MGIHAGPALPFVAAYILANSSDVAVLERDTFVPDLSLAHLMRLAKSPRNFSLRSLREPTAYPGLLPSLSEGLRVIGECDATVPSIAAALYHWFNRLTPYALQTDELSPAAVAVRDQLRRGTDPADLFFLDLLNACRPPNPRVLQCTRTTRHSSRHSTTLSGSSTKPYTISALKRSKPSETLLEPQISPP